MKEVISGESLLCGTAGRDAQVRVEDGALHISVGTTEVGTHPVLPGSRRTSRYKDHFSGLLGTVMKKNSQRLHKFARILQFSEPLVENHSLSFMIPSAEVIGNE
jgi:hypothetical protein